MKSAATARHKALAAVAVTLVLGLFAAFSLALNVANPIWEGIDEPGHFQYVKFLAERHHFPSEEEPLPILPISGVDVNCNNVRCLGRGSVDLEPPVYYILEAPFVAPINMNEDVSWVANPYFTWANHPLRNGAAIHTLTEAWPYHGMVLGVHVMRAVSGLMVAGALLALYFLAKAIVRDWLFAVLATATAGLMPGLVLTSATVNNDNGAILMGTSSLLFGVKMVTDTARRKLWLALFTVAAALSIETKASAYYLLPVCLCCVVLSVAWARKQGIDWREDAISGIVVLGLLTGLAIKTMRNDVAGSILSFTTVFTTLGTSWPCDCHLFAQPLWGGIPNMWETHWGSYGWETFHIPSPFYRVFLLITLGGLAGLAILLVRRREALRLRRLVDTPTRRGLAVLLTGLLSLGFAVNYRYWATHSDGGSTHGRFLFPAIACTAVFLMLGLYCLPKLLRLAGIATLFATCIAVLVHSVAVLPTSFGPTPPVYGDLTSAGAQNAKQVNFANNLHVLGWSATEPGGVRPGDTVHLRLFWETSIPAPFDYSAFVRLEAKDDNAIIHDSDHGPGQSVGLLPHDWQPGEVVPDDWSIAIPSSAHAGTYDIVVGMYDYRDMGAVFIPEIIGKNNFPATWTVLGTVQVLPR